jgi:hypothetical protein
MIDIESFLTDHPVVDYEEYMDKLKFNRTIHRNALCYQFLELKCKDNPNEYYFKSLKAVYDVADFFQQKIKFYICTAASGIPFALIDVEDLKTLLEKSEKMNKPASPKEKKDCGSESLSQGPAEIFQTKVQGPAIDGDFTEE